MIFKDRGIEIKTREQILSMRVAGLVVGRTLDLLRGQVKAGITTGELDAIAEDYIRSSGAVPSFKGYHGFTGSICASVNDEIVHGIPGERVLGDGDIISIDCGAIVDGWHGDAAITVGVGEVDPALIELAQVCEDAMWRGFAAAKLGGRLTDISAAVERHVRAKASYGIVTDFVGHGIGSAMHQPPNVPNYGRPGRGPKLVEGLALAVEPMLTLGEQDNHTLEDDWTVVTDDGLVAVHTEHTFTLTPQGPWVLTALDGGAAKLAELGIRCGALAD
ncbi:MAG: methionyl aminopeptidase [Pseudonocardiales bacterium]|nr:methionyl aminopeptidase [Pseudonocardiales bacterium]MDX6293028.1 methionyl aminopeptidase [Kribbellaceae bacterium]